jgi:hypothetical protein
VQVPAFPASLDQLAPWVLFQAPLEGLASAAGFVTFDVRLRFAVCKESNVIHLHGFSCWVYLDNARSQSEILYRKFRQLIFQNGINFFSRQLASVRSEIWKCSQNCFEVTGFSGAAVSVVMSSNEALLTGNVPKFAYLYYV